MMFPMSTSRPVATLERSKNYHHGNLRNVLLASARELAAEQNIDGFRLREVARRAGVSHTAAYNHFADKAALVEALVIEAFATLTGELQAAAASSADLLIRLERIGVAYVSFAYRHAAEFRFMWRPEYCVAKPGARDGEALRAASIAAYDVLVNAVAAALQAGTLAGDPETFVLTAWAAVHGLAALLVDGPQRDDALTLLQVESRARDMTRVLIGGMLARG
jgi:AcrR family transcriptional regulator